MKRFLVSLILICCAFAVFAQNVYEVDLSKLPAVNDDKTATFDKATKTVTVTANDKLQWGGNRGVYLWLNNLDISTYNIARVKYKVIGDYGFHFTLDYDDNTLDWTNDKTTYCPSYLNEMVIPLKSNQIKLKGIFFQGAESVPYEQFVIESVTFEKVDNPKLTDVYASNEPPVIDKATSGKFDDKISAWDYVKNLGVGFQYQAFATCENSLDFGMDCFHLWGFKKPSKEIIHFIKQKGFKTIRLQTSPNGGHLLDENYTIDPRYIKALKEVVDWIIEEDMYVIVCGSVPEFMEFNESFQKKVKESVHFEALIVSEDYKKTTEALLKAIWKQYATAFNNSYDEHLIFETINNPTHTFHEHAWDPISDCAVCKKDYAIMNEYNQIIVDTIRSTGGNNAKRFIMVEGIGGRWKYITNSLFKMPKDKTKDRLIPTAQNIPLGFTLGSDPGAYGRKVYTEGVRKEINAMFDALDKTYFKNHVPVYISETGGGPLGIPVMERINCMKDFMAEVSKDGRSCAITLHPCDDYQNNSHDFDPWNIKWNEKPEYFDTIFYGAQGKEYPLSAEFIKNNETKVESIVGKNLLPEPVVRTGNVNWDNNYKILSETFYRSTPAKYKIELEIEKTGADPFLRFAYIDWNYNWHDGGNTPLLKKMRIKGGILQPWGSIKVQSKKLILSIDEDLAKELANGEAVYLNGQDIIIKSMKVVE